MKRLRNTLCVLSISIVVLCGFVTARDEKYVSYFLHLYSAGLFRDRNFVLHDAKAYFNKDHIVRVEMSFSCYKNLSLEEARKMLCQVAMEFVDRVNADPGLKEKALIKDRFIPRQLHLRILCDNILGQTYETNFIREIILDRGHVSYITFKNVPEWYGISSTFHEDFDYALMLVGNRRSQDEIIDQSNVKPQILGIPGDVSDFPLRQYHELLPEAEFPIPKKEKAAAQAPVVPVLVQIIPVELFSELGLWTPPPPPPPPVPPPVEKPEEVKPQTQAPTSTEVKQPVEAKPVSAPATTSAPNAAPQAQKEPVQQPAVAPSKADVVPNTLQPQAQVPVATPQKEAGVAPQAPTAPAPTAQTEPKAPSTEKPAESSPKSASEMPERLKVSEEKGKVLLSKNEPVQDPTDKSKIPSLPENQIADSETADEQVDLIQLLQNALDNLSETKDKQEATKQAQKPATPPSQSADTSKQKTVADLSQEPVAVVEEVMVAETKDVPFISFDAESPQRTTPASQAKGFTESDKKMLYIEATSEKAFLQTPKQQPVEVLGEKQAVALDEAPTNNESMQEATVLNRLMNAAEQDSQDSPEVEETPEDDDQDLEMPEYPVEAEEVVQIDVQQAEPKQIHAHEERGFLDFLFGSAKKEQPASPPSQEKPNLNPPSDAQNVAVSDADEPKDSRSQDIQEAPNVQKTTEEIQPVVPDQQDVKPEPKKGFFDFLFGSSEKEASSQAQPTSDQDNDTFDTSDADEEDDDVVGLADDLDEDDDLADQESDEQSPPAASNQEVKPEPKKGFFDFLFGSSQKETKPEATVSDVQDEVAMSDEDELQASNELGIKEAIASEETTEQTAPSAPPAAEQKQEEKQEVKQEPKKGFFDFLFGSSQKEAQADDNAAEDVVDEGLVAMADDDSDKASRANQEQKQEENQGVKQEPKKGFFDFLFGSSQKEAQADDNAAEDVVDEGLVAMGDDDSDQSDNARASHDPVLAELFSEPTDWLDDRAATAPSGNWAVSKEGVQSTDAKQDVRSIDTASRETEEAPGTLHRWYNSLKMSVESLFSKKEQQANVTDIQEKETVEIEEVVQEDPQAPKKEVEKVLIFTDEQS